ncbi:unnamed protein product [Effrenium voratum]|nr:unnamed protein product [Effrenium voratum]
MAAWSVTPARSCVSEPQVALRTPPTELAMFCACCEAPVDAAAVEVDAQPSLVEKGYRSEVVTATVTSVPEKAKGNFKAEVMLKKGMGLGLELDVVDPKGPTIVEVGTDGLIAEFNAASRHLALQKFDRITGVNQEKGDMSHVYKTLNNAIESQERASMELDITRPTEFKVTLVKSGEPLGTQLNFKQSSAGIVLTKITDGGLVAKWNIEHPDQKLLVGDRVVAVNGQYLKGADMVERIKAEKSLEFTVLRY